MPILQALAFEAEIVAKSLMDYLNGGALRLGVTGLSRSGKTIFITALVQNLLQQSRLPVLRVWREHRLLGATLAMQPDDAIARFNYEDHLAALSSQDRCWPHSTRRISQLRLTIEFLPIGGNKQARKLNLDIVDYPGEWLLDLPLLNKSYQQWSREMLASSATSNRAALAKDWRHYTLSLDPLQRGDEVIARRLSELYTAYLRSARSDLYALSTLPPGRFLMPGDMEGSPALTFAPLPPPPPLPPLLPLSDAISPKGSLAAMMERRFEAYKKLVIRPFFRDHFSRLDRQIVLVDTLAALNSGPAALRDLENALVEILQSFRSGNNYLFSNIFRPKIDKILFAATKADHLHHENHDRLEAILRHLTARAIARVEDFGARVDVIALSAMRATREALVKPDRNQQNLKAIIGIPLAGEMIDGEVFDGQSEAAIFPGQLPKDPETVFRGDGLALVAEEAAYRFVRFRPPIPRFNAEGKLLPAASIRLDRAMEFLLGDRLS